MRFGRITHVPVTDSTNDDMAAILGTPEAYGLTIVADYQRAGAGRRGRNWVAPPGSSLLFTTALPQPIPAGHLWAVPFWIALVVRAALAEFDITVALQWPNDLLLNGRKAAGILCISRVTGDLAWAACGVGINVRRPAGSSDLAAISPPPAWLDDEQPVDSDVLLQTILAEAERQFDDLAHPEMVARAWERAAGVPGTRYRILVDGEPDPFDSRALRLSADGALIVEHAGRQRTIALADARVLRE